MNRRTYISSLAAIIGVLSGRDVMGTSPDDSQPGYYGQESVVYEHDSIDLRLCHDLVRLGDSLEFEITNTGDSKISIGCNTPWALQKDVDGTWRHVTWTVGDFYNLCLTLLSPGSSLVESLTFSESELENQADDVHGELTPGKYRFLLIGMSPYVALDFDVLEVS